jgi:hypothetical protein
MEARGFGAGARTHVAPPRISAADWIVIASSAAAVGLFIASTAAGWAEQWAPYPLLTAPAIDPRPLLACALLFVPVVTWRSRR